MSEQTSGQYAGMNLIEALQFECNRVREIKRIYEELPGAAGKPAAIMMQADIGYAEYSIAHMNTVAMIGALKMLKSWEL